jgi:PAS domain S-box-containing protein
MRLKTLTSGYNIARDLLQKPADNLKEQIEKLKAELAAADMRLKDEISRRKQAEEAFKVSEERFHQFFEQNEEALMIFKSGTCEIIDVNPAAVNLLGYTKQELIEYGPCLFVEQEEFQNLKQIICDIDLVEGLRIMTYKRKDGTKRLLTFSGKVIRLHESYIVYFSFRDITEKIRLKEEARFRQAQLIHANKMASLGMLVSGIVHEINNPNDFIMHNAQLVTEAWQDAFPILAEYYRQYGEFSLGGIPFSEMHEVIPRLLLGITDGSVRIKNIVDTMKNFVRADKANLDGKVYINKVIVDSVLILNNQINKYTEKFYLDFGKDLPPVKGSAQKLEQVIINLIMNSLQALPNKKCGIWISTSSNKDSGCVIISIKDEGCGMSRKVLERIMEPFFSTKLNTGGTGLGLYISQSIVKEHRGSMEFESEHAKGTTVVIKLPSS